MWPVKVTFQMDTSIFVSKGSINGPLGGPEQGVSMRLVFNAAPFCCFRFLPVSGNVRACLPMCVSCGCACVRALACVFVYVCVPKCGSVLVESLTVHARKQFCVGLCVHAYVCVGACTCVLDR